MGTVAYKLKLLENSLIHPVFHVFMLKKYTKRAAVKGLLPQVIDKNAGKVLPLAILDQRMVNKRERSAKQVLVHWNGMTAEDSTWEDWVTFDVQFPEFAKVNPRD